MSRLTSFFRLTGLMARASFKQQTRTRAAVISNVLTPTIFASIFLLQILLYYRIKPQPFAHLPIAQYLVCFFASQIILFLVFDRSLMRLRKAILSGDIDLMLLRPVNLFFFKYLRHLDIQIPYILFYSFVGLWLSEVAAHTSIGMNFKILVFIAVAGLIRSNSVAILTALAFFSRDSFGIRGIYQALDQFTNTKPPEIFPSVIEFSLTYILPFILVQGYIFDLVRGRDSVVFWLNCLFWIGLTAFINQWIWQRGLERYESIG